MSMAQTQRTATEEAVRLGGGNCEYVWSLVDAARAGDRQAFATLYQLHRDEVFRYVFARTGDQPRAEDLTSETFLRAMIKIDSVTHRGSSFRAWLMTIARNLVFDESRSARHRLEVTMAEHVEIPAATADPAVSVCIRAWAEELHDYLLQLSDDQRACLELRYFHDLPLSDVASRMNRRPNAVSAVHVRALCKLREVVSAHWGALAS